MLACGGIRMPRTPTWAAGVDWHACLLHPLGVRAPGQKQRENLALAIARGVPGVDVILMGHTHREMAPVVVNGARVIQNL